MSWLLDFVYGLAAQNTQKVVAWWRRGVVGTVLLGFCGLAALGGLGFIGAGSYASLSETLEPWKAGLIVGIVALLLSLIGALLVWIFLLRKESTQASAPKPASDEFDVDTIAHLGETIGASLFKNGIRTTDIMLAALVAGTVLGASPALRERLLRRKRSTTDKSSSNSRSRNS